jgi:hypothetical protein
VENTELLAKLRQVEENAWMLFAELPHSAARNRALHVYLDAKELKTRLEKLEATVTYATPRVATESGR